MLAVRLSDGNRLWSADVASAYMPVVSGNAIFAVTIDGRVVAVNKATGELIWSNQLPTGTKKKRISYAGPLLAGGRLYVGTSEGQLLSFEPTNGQAAGSTTIGEPIFIAPIAVGGRIFVLGDKGSLIALQ
jgi:outer membrane protein assembly factor BamB